MKYVITEEQNIRVQVLRRLEEDWPLIREIVDEGTDIYDPCDFKDKYLYLDRVAIDSARTWLYHYYYVADESREDTEFSIMLRFVTSYIKEKMGRDIRGYYEDNTENC
jgi:hypothetical protein